jgi:hypothetical protein
MLNYLKFERYINNRILHFDEWSFQGIDQDSLKSEDYIIKAVPYLMEMGNFCSNSGYGIHTTEIILYETFFNL